MAQKLWFTVCLIFFSIGFGLSPAYPANRVAASGAQRGPRVREVAKAPVSGGVFYVNSNFDYTTSNDELSLREALLIASGGTGGDGVNTGLHRGLTTSEENQTVGCTFDVTGDITGGCGPGKSNEIVFDSKLGITPTITLVNGSLPPISNTAPTTISGWGASVVIDGDGLAETVFEVDSSNNQIEYLAMKNFRGFGILIGSDNNTIYAVSASNSVSSGTGISIGGNGNTVNYATLVSNPTDGIDIAGLNNKVGGSIIRKNGLVGLTVYGHGSQNNLIGGPSFGNTLTGNTISANGIGVRLEDAASSVLAGNKIGTTADGLSADGNNDQGIEVINSNGNFIGDPAAAPNIISGNVGWGVFIQDSSNNQVANNLIGASSSLGALGNGLDGIYLGGSMTATVSANVIAFNKSGGVTITDHTNPGQGNLVQGNTIKFNQQDGVYLGGYFSPFNNSITNDSIYNNGRDGIHEFVGAYNNYWSQISTYNNGGLGIFTQAGTAPAHPAITSATSNGIQWTISGTATASSPFSPVSVEVYLAAPDPTGFGEGKTYLGTAGVNNSGHWSMTTPDSNFSCFTAFETRSDFLFTIGASSDFSKNVCRLRLFLPLIRR